MDDIIARRRLKAVTGKRKRPVEDEEEDVSGSEALDEDDETADSDASEEGSEEEDFGGGVNDDELDDPLASSEDEEGSEEEDDGSEVGDDEDVEDDDSSDESESETREEKARKTAFFASETAAKEVHSSFISMNLSRPILKSLTTLGFNTPTPIQAATIPVALLGKDVVGNAVTGSGKTAAFIIPMLERLLYRERGKRAAATRCLVLVPTRELGVQCFEVGKKLAAHTDVQFCLAVGELKSFGYAFLFLT